MTPELTIETSKKSKAPKAPKAPKVAKTAKKRTAAPALNADALAIAETEARLHDAESTPPPVLETPVPQPEPAPPTPPSAPIRAKRFRAPMPVCSLCGLRHQPVEQYRKRAAASSLPMSEEMRAWFAKHGEEVTVSTH